MVQKKVSDSGFPKPRPQRLFHLLFHPMEAPSVDFPIQSVRIDWDRLVAKRPTVLDTIDAMPAYLLKPEILRLLDAEKQPTFRLILDIMWTSGARISEVLALNPSSFVDGGYDFGVILKTLKQRPGDRATLASNAHPNAISRSSITRWKTAFRVIFTPGISKRVSACSGCAGRQ